MTDTRKQRRRRPRLTAEDRERLLAEIAKYGPFPAEKEAELRSVLTGGPAGILLPRVIDVWNNLLAIEVDRDTLDRNLVITASRVDPAHAAFDVLRTRMVQALADNNWRRVGITSPTRDCGKSFTAVNLAITLSRYDTCRTVLLDMDLRHPGLGRYLGAQPTTSTGDFLRGQIPAEAFLRKIGDNDLQIGDTLAIGLNSRVEPYAAELFQTPRTGEVLDRMMTELTPDVVLYDLPPALAQDDVIAFRDHIDCVLIVVGGGITTADEVRETVRRVGEDKPVIGVVLNKADDSAGR